MSILGRVARWLPLLLYCGLIYHLSSAPPPEFAHSDVPGSDKVLHVGAYAVWGFLCGWALAGSLPRLTGGWFVLIVTTAGVLYGFSDEFHQSFVKERTADPWDLLADLAGSLLGACVAFAWIRRDRKRPEGRST